MTPHVNWLVIISVDSTIDTRTAVSRPLQAIRGDGGVGTLRSSWLGVVECGRAGGWRAALPPSIDLTAEEDDEEEERPYVDVDLSQRAALDWWWRTEAPRLAR